MSTVMGLRPGQKRRLAAEQAIYRRFENFKECNDACARYCQMKGLSVTFNNMTIQQYVGCQTNMSLKRLKVLAAVLGITNYPELDEVFVAPEHRGEGLFWEGENGNKIKDITIHQIY
jgi:hypothetical protein